MVLDKRLLIIEDHISEFYLCEICKDVMRTPIQTCRGNVACLSCYEKAAKKLTPGICPLDKQPITDEQIYLDKARQNEIYNLSCVCPKLQFGCHWKGIIKNLEEHARSCIFDSFSYYSNYEASNGYMDVESAIQKQLNDLKSQFQQFQHEIMKSIERNSTLVTELDLRLQLHENTTYDGKCIWKLDNFERRLQEAVIGKATTLHSAPCYTSRCGYKYCLRTHLNGNDSKTKSHVSLYFVLMKSDYDNLLSWPFEKQIHVALKNQNDRKMDINQWIENSSRYPDCFQKPSSHMNDAAGKPLIIPHSKLLAEQSGFVKDDSIFFEVNVC